MDGYLEKRSAGIIKVWQKRWFSRDLHQLQYFGKRDDTIPKGVLNLFDVTQVEIVAPSVEDDSRTRFNIVAKNKVYQLRAPSKTERDAWVEALAVWVSSAGREDPMPPPRRMARGILAAINWIMVNEHSKNVKGLFRVPGSVGSINEIFNQVCIHGEAYFKAGMMPDNYEVHDVCSALKKLIRQLPESLLTNKLLKQFQEATDSKTVKSLVSQLPAWNAICLCKLIELCQDICENTKRTMMTPGALAICLGPNLCAKEDMLFFNYTSLFTVMIENKDYIFRDIDLEDSITEKGQSTTELLDRFMDEVKYVDSISSRRDHSRRELPSEFAESGLSRQKAKKNVIQAEIDNGSAEKAGLITRVLSSDSTKESIPETGSAVVPEDLHHPYLSVFDSHEIDGSLKNRSERQLLKKESVDSIPTVHRSMPLLKFGPPPAKQLDRAQGSSKRLGIANKNKDEQSKGSIVESKEENKDGLRTENAPQLKVDSSEANNPTPLPPNSDENTAPGLITGGDVLSEIQVYAMETDNLCEQVEAALVHLSVSAAPDNPLKSLEDPNDLINSKEPSSENVDVGASMASMAVMQEDNETHTEEYESPAIDHVSADPTVDVFDSTAVSLAVSQMIPNMNKNVGFLETPDVSPVRKSSLWHSDIMMSFIDIIGQTQMEIMELIDGKVDQQLISQVEKVHEEQLRRLDVLFKSPRFTTSSYFTVPPHASTPSPGKIEESKEQDNSQTISMTATTARLEQLAQLQSNEEEVTIRQ
jgi:hypothetical protein